MNTRGKMFAYMAAIFLAGGLAGGIVGANYGRGDSSASPGRTQVADRIRDHLQSKAGLSASQVEEINPLIDETASRLEAVHLKTMEEVGEIFTDFHNRIAGPAGLTDEQKGKLAQLENEHADALKKEKSSNVPVPRIEESPAP